MRVEVLSNLPIPARQTDGAAGYDLQSNVNIIINPTERALVPTGYAWEIPVGKVGIIKDRSSMAYKHGLSVMAGVIDSDYRGEVKALIVNLSNSPYTICVGDRVAQIVIVDHYSDKLVLADKLDNFDRNGGFGSTGK